ncbi:MAG TPA: carboxypeptidase-like regulatory domain-containing protein [Flavitalea sp.]|nr:carboxypeptidase-like regulatory domain-containing protein [Flavitalea sp.]
MGDNNNHIKTYTPEEIQSYLDGRMTAAEMHALELAALEDPFLADAMEGYMHTGANAGNADVELREALKERLAESSRNRILPGWLKIAAASAVLVTTVVSITLVVNPPTSNQAILASQEAPKKVTDTPAEVVNAEPGNQKPGIKREREDRTQVPDSTVRKKQTWHGNKQEINLKEAELDHKAEEAVATMSLADERRSQKSMASALMGSVRGVVIDSNNRPVPGAVVSMAKQQVVTNDSGMFVLAPTDTMMKVEVQSVGFTSREAIVKNDAKLDTIILSPSAAALSEVVVTGYGTQRGSSRNRKADKEIASPSIPWQKYHEYIKTNLQSSKLDTIPGEAIISFTVNAEGKLSDFDIEKDAPTPELNELLIDVIKRGPKWRANHGKSARGSLRISLGAGQ